MLIRGAGQDHRVHRPAVFPIGGDGPRPGILRRTYPNNGPNLNPQDRRLGEKARAVFVNALAEPGGRVQKAALDGLKQLGPEAGPAARDVAAMLKDVDPDVRRRALWAISAMHEAGKAAIPALQKVAGDQTDPLHKEAGEVLNNLETQWQNHGDGTEN